MSSNDEKSPRNENKERPPQQRPEQAQRALAEAAARKEDIDRANKAANNEQGGRGGLDPARFGDWEVKGITSDF